MILPLLFSLDVHKSMNCSSADAVGCVSIGRQMRPQNRLRNISEAPFWRLAGRLLYSLKAVACEGYGAAGSGRGPRAVRGRIRTSGTLSGHILVPLHARQNVA
jgi:hypothetical protein